MKKAILILLAVILLAQSVAVLAEKQVFAYQGDVAFFEENGLMGLQDDKGNMLHKAEFVSAKPFDVNNLAHVYLPDGRQGYIDRQGSYAIEPMMADYLGFGYRWVNYAAMPDKVIYLMKGKTGLISLTGEMLMPAEYDDIYPFSNDKNLVEQDGKWYLMDNQGNRLLENTLDNINYDLFFGVTINGDEEKCYNLNNGICIYQESPEGIQYTDEKGHPVDVSAWDELYFGRGYKKGIHIWLEKWQSGHIRH